MVASGVTRLGQIEIDGEDIYWSEMRPSEAGRCVIVKHSSDGETIDVNPPPFNARTRVHEYGGGAYKVNNDVIYFTDFKDQRIYKMKLGEKPWPITPKTALRYADIVFDNPRGRILCVREDHRKQGEEAINTIISMDLNGKDTKKIVFGNDFYSSPRISPDGRHLAWVTWNHPYMPWDKTELWMGKLSSDNLVEKPTKITREREESVLQPLWSPDSILYFISDRSNWWNIYCWKHDEVTPICLMEAEYATPPWVFTQSNYAFESENKIINSYVEKGEWHISQLYTETGEIEEIETPYTQISDLHVLNNYAVFIGGSAQETNSIVKLDLETGYTEVLKRSSEISVDLGYLSKPTPIEFPTEKNLTAYAIYYQPHNKDYFASSNEQPPLLVFVHGGPTSTASATLSWPIQFWTSRGFAIVNVNYSGSSGYGREYRQRLYGQWGVVDIDDCVNAAKYLVNVGEGNGDKLAIRGGSAGGYTTINALTFRDVFNVGASYYGISDLEVFVQDTHKFESRYLDTLIGPYPDTKDLYRNRSVINSLEKLRTPMILFQGLEDKIVPPNQAELIVKELREKGIPHAYIPFDGEQHGFRQAKNIKRSLEAELYFYSKIFGFELGLTDTPVVIENLKE
jgi:dipeptidyl aminopeptidase/acylaminoacyl peptidase